MRTLTKDHIDEFIINEGSGYKLVLVFDSPLDNINVEVPISEQVAKVLIDGGTDIIYAHQ